MKKIVAMLILSVVCANGAWAGVSAEECPIVFDGEYAGVRYKDVPLELAAVAVSSSYPFAFGCKYRLTRDLMALVTILSRKPMKLAAASNWAVEKNKLVCRVASPHHPYPTPCVVYVEDKLVGHPAGCSSYKGSPYWWVTYE